MITRYTEYIKENLDTERTYTFIKDILIQYEINNITYNYKWLNISRKYNIWLEFNGDAIIDILYDYNKEIFAIRFFDNEEEISYNEEDDIDWLYNEVEKVIKNFLNKYYEYLLEYLIKFDDMRIQDIPVIDKEKYLDFMEDILLNNKKYKIFDDDDMIEKQDNIINLFINKVYHNEDFKFMKEDFDKRFKHLINANNFDLI